MPSAGPVALLWGHTATPLAFLIETTRPVSRLADRGGAKSQARCRPRAELRGVRQRAGRMENISGNNQVTEVH